MMVSNRNITTSSSHAQILSTEKKLNFDCHSLALNKFETRLLLVGNQDLACINLDTVYPHHGCTMHEACNILLETSNDVEKIRLFDPFNVNRAVVEWNHSEPNQFAVAIDRVARIYTIEHGKITDTSMIIDSQHQRPISTISYSPFNSAWLLTGSLDGQIQLWDTRISSTKSPANLKFAHTVPFSIRRMQWSSTQSESSNQLAVQFDKCVRIYDLRRADSYLSSPVDIEHTQRILGMEWSKQNMSVVTLSRDNSIKVFSAKGQLLAESLPNDKSIAAISKFRTTMYDNLFICAYRRPSTDSINAFLGWHRDESQQLKSLTTCGSPTTTSSIVDFHVVKNTRLLELFEASSISHVNDDLIHCLLLTWCSDGNLYLVDMDSKFREFWSDTHTHAKRQSSLYDGSHSMSNSRTSFNSSRNSSSALPMETMKIGLLDSGDALDDFDDDNAFQEMPESPHTSLDQFDGIDDNDYQTIPDRTNNTVTEVTIENEMNSLLENYGRHIIVESKDDKRRACILRCIYPSDDSSFYISLILSHFYPIISQLNIVFKILTINNDERFKLFQSHVKKIIDETCYKYFYNGQLCLHECLVKLKNFFEAHYKQERALANKQATLEISLTKRDQTSNHAGGIGAMANFNSNNQSHPNETNNSSNQRFAGSSSTITTESQLSVIPVSDCNRRTCGARFSGGSHLVCFGRTTKTQQSKSTTGISTLVEVTSNRPQSLPLRSTSLTVAKTRENSGTDEQSTYRTATVSNTVKIQQMQNNQRYPVFSAPARPTFVSSMINEHQRISQSFRRSHSHLSSPQSIVSIYDISILLPVSKKLADDYKIDLANPLDMCETNQLLAREMGKHELSHCWHMLAGLLSVKTSLQDDSWFQTPMAQGLVKHIVLNHIMNGDIQSASMFVLAMSETSLLKGRQQSKIINEHEYDPILYAYATLLHRWRHFYKRTQILSQIDHNCQSPAPLNQIIPNAQIVCSICSQPVLGQHFLCAICGHGGHLTHMHDWFAAEGSRHRICPEKDCTCRCIFKQQELLTLHTNQLHQQQQQQAPTIGSRSYYRQPSGNVRPL